MAMMQSADPTPANVGVSRRLEQPSEPRLSLTVFGNMRVSFQGHTLKIKNRKSQALLAFLALSDNPRETREKLIGIFWSESDERRGQASLRHALRELREGFLNCGFDGLYTEKLTVELDREKIEVDL